MVAFPPGGLADNTARPVAAALERLLKQPVPIINKPGAAGAVGNQVVATSKPDGYTLLMALVSVSVLPEVDKLFGRPQNYTLDQLTGIARINADPSMLVVRADAPWKTLKDLVDDAKKRPGEIVFTSSGLYGAAHIPMEMFIKAAGIKMRHLPTTGGGPMMNAMLGGHAQVVMTPVSLAAQHVKAGQAAAARPQRDRAGRRLSGRPLVQVPGLRRRVHRVGGAGGAEGHAAARHQDPARRDAAGGEGAGGGQLARQARDPDRLHGRRRVQRVVGQGRGPARRGGEADRQGGVAPGRAVTVDRVAGVALVLIGLVTIWESRAFPLGSLHRPGPAYMPVVLAALLILFGAAVFAMDARVRRLAEVGWPEWRHALAIFGACAFAAWGLERLGYRLTMAVVVAFLLLVVERKGWALGLALTVAMAWGSFYLFDTLLRVPLPRGPFGL